MRTRFLVVITALMLICQVSGTAQTSRVPRVEVGAEFTTMIRDDESGLRTEVGVGTRVTYNLTDNIALETAAYLFPRRCLNCNNAGRLTEVVSGIKAGKRFKSFGVFLKARPGFVSFSEGASDFVSNPNSVFSFSFERKRLTNFAADLGAVVEFYPSKHIITRFDAGDTLIHFGERKTNRIGFDFPTNSPKLFPFTTPAKTTHNFQFTAGVGYRF